jgi:hypothetical protein
MSVDRIGQFFLLFAKVNLGVRCAVEHDRRLVFAKRIADVVGSRDVERGARDENVTLATFA